VKRATSKLLTNLRFAVDSWREFDVGEYNIFSEFIIK
jgi:hypothetical protein